MINQPSRTPSQTAGEENGWFGTEGTSDLAAYISSSLFESHVTRPGGRTRQNVLRQALDPAVVGDLRRLHNAGIVDAAQLVGLDAERLEQDGIAALVGVQVVGGAI